MNNKIYNCLIVDDEPIARKIVQAYIEKLPNLECTVQAKNAIEALEILNKDPGIEIVFLDINMPNLSGMSMAKILNTPPKIIFTTAYTEYAIESYEINAVDYLLKPFSFERFAKAAFKAIDLIEKSKTGLTPEIKTEEQQIFIKSEGKNYPVSVNDILYCEAKKNYTKIVLKNDKTYLPLIPLSKFEDELKAISSNFIRVHRSFIVSSKEIASVGAQQVFIGKYKIPLGEQYKIDFFEKIGIKK
ncbi:MAG: DNA-binding response regulator [Bacteroidetes bacterium]|nr:DNA-binding response regulator [Bacteroidota bacterium]